MAPADEPVDLVEVSLPGGRLAAAQLQILAELAHDHAGGALVLTADGLGLRGNRAELTAQLSGHGFDLPGPHRRRLLASPLSGRIGGHVDVRDILAEVHRRLTALAPGRDLVVGIDDGSGDIAALAPEVGAAALPDRRWALLLDGTDTGVRLPPDDVVETLVAAAQRPPRAGVAATLAALGVEPSAPPARCPSAPARPVGWLDQLDGAVTLGGGLPGAVLPARTAEFLAAVDRPLVVTPWSVVLLCDLDEWAAEQVVRVLAPMGLVFDADSPELR
ncbi:precorrin-3B synthase [Rhodococcus ruber]|uniref:precorrin-3B synthase n=1 Tax=Rhodococcus ruber TaxID=1830 RepID=UPI000E6AE8F5|nr:precorrin-3B synthase [Rhodococcus ruber]AXY52378.1 precorrin-3B synthase [Rhodococcus ruber]MDO1478597.1 precorrin-3B synthase [Rhodococcus ruber]UQB70706.1 precorrin-3B synthase [Rhodococcus ruber]